MNGTELFKHAFGMIERNLGAAVRMSAVLFVTSLVLQFVPTVLGMTDPALMFSHGMMSYIALAYLPSLVAIVLGVWVAVAWHRYVLLEEDPASWIPAFHGREVQNYVLWMILLFLIYVLMLLPIFLVGVLAIPGIESGNNPSAFVVLLFVILFLVTITVAVIVFTRLSTCLVARAVSRRLSLAEAWNATRGSGQPILVCMLILMGVMIAFGVIISILVFVIGIVGMIVAIPLYMLFTWAVMFFQISLMTTLYGHYVEGRGLVA